MNSSSSLHSLNHRTSSHVHAICQQFFYRAVYLNNLRPIGALQGLARHADVICSLKADQQSISHNYLATIYTLFQDPTALPTLFFEDMGLPSDTTAEAPDQFTCPSQLASLLSQEILLDNLCRRNAFGAQLLYIACSSPRLTVLALDRIYIRTDLDRDILARTISSLGTLQSLFLSTRTNYSDIGQVLMAVVTNCPSLVESPSLCITLIVRDGIVPGAQQQDSDKLPDRA